MQIAELSCVMQQRQLELPRQYTFHNSYWMKPRQPSFFWGTVHKYFDRRDWLLHYRMDKATFFEVLESIRHLIGLEDTNWRAAVTAEQLPVARRPWSTRVVQAMLWQPSHTVFH